MTRRPAQLLLALTMLAPALAYAQQPPPPRPLGPIMAVSKERLASIATAVDVGHGRVYANDIAARRLLYFDSTLTQMTVVADSDAAYGPRPGTLLAYRGDSAYFITPQDLAMLVLSPSGTIARTVASPPNLPNGGGMLVGGVFGLPALDANGRLVYFAPVRQRQSTMLDGPPPAADSALLIRFDFGARKLDTAGAFHIPKAKMTVTRENDRVAAMVSTAYPPQTVDAWSVTSDGAVAIVRGRDYHVDWLGSDGRWSSTPRMAYSWERVTDEQKAALIDSTSRAQQENLDSLMSRAQRAQSGTAPPVGARDGGGVGRAGGGSPGGPIPKLVAARAELTDVPDYRPPFGQGTVRADMSGSLWIRTNTLVNGQPVYDVVNRRGELTDRVLLPAFRTIAGFGPGVVYLAVKDSVNVVHLERARIGR